MRQEVGVVYFVDCGPGDENLLTVRAREVLGAADAIVHDAAGTPFLALAPESTERIALDSQGTRSTPGSHAAVLIELARLGKRVVRLHGGETAVAEPEWSEALALTDAGIPFEVVPEVPAAVAWPAYAGIPLAHGAASHVTLASSHDAAPTGGELRRLLAGRGTFVARTDGVQLASVVARLAAGGAPPDLPAAVIAAGTSPRQRVVTGPLARIGELVRGEGLHGVLVLVAGDVVRLRDRLAWFERRPLFGRQIVVTRARAQASALIRQLQVLGALVIELPAIRIEAPPDVAALDAHLARLGEYDWVIFTSANGVRSAFERLDVAGRDARAFGAARACAIGPGTARALAERGIRADLVPERFVAEGLIEALRRERAVGAGSRILVARAAEAREVLPEALRAWGARVDVVAAYQTSRDSGNGADLARRLLDGEIDWVTFTSSSTVRNFVGLVGGAAARCGRFRSAVIGPITARTAREAGLEVGAEAVQHTIPGLVRALVAVGSRRP